ncbi:MAG: cytochrome C oxidase subunit IV family protein [Trueperaceae bacterium]|nr:cytochrome C oxidase subunit IV family protein [Trueperaceae bacterium]HRQ09809.1 cytochrome C oxidase subunit IV family protein [Trueperaceae bacterium]
MAETKHSSVTTYLIVAIILGVITYIEFALVEYPQAWLGPSWTLVWLITLSVVKFVMVVMFFMHLKADDRTYTGFFSSGMFIAMATFVGLTAMFVLPRAVSATRPQNVVAGKAAHNEIPEAMLENVRTGGASRGPAQIADNPRVKDRTVPIAAPLASNDASTYTVNVATPPAAEEAGATPSAAEAPSGAGEAASATTPTTEAPSGEAPSGEAASGAPAGAAPAATTVSWDQEHGKAVFNANCMACHQASGEGIPGAFPPLAGHSDDIYALDGGRQYLLDTVLFGLQGPITVNGAPYNGVMPAWGHLADGDIADALNHALTAWSDPPADFQPYVAADVEARRPDNRTPDENHAAREALGLD